MISPASLQQALLALICFSEESATLISRRVKVESFLGRQNKLLATTALEYLASYGRPPGQQLEFLLEKELRRGEDGKLLGQTLDLIRDQLSGIQVDFILKELDSFEEIQRTTTAAQQALEELAQGNLEKAKESLSAIKVVPSAKLSDGIWLADSKKMLSFLDKTDTDYFSSGIEAIDEVGARPERKTLTIMIAPTGRGKSWFLVGCAKAAIQYHNTACVITLELNQEKWAKRLVQSIFSLSQYEVKEIRVPIFDTSTGISQIQFRDLVRDPVIKKRKEIAQRLADFNTKIILKEFPSGTLTLSGLHNYLDYLEKEENFKPDELLLDYAQLMKLDVDNLRIAVGRLTVGLRGLATERNLAVITACQGSKDSDTARVVDRSHAAEDWSQIGTADIVYTMSQTPSEKKLGLSRILIAKSRDSSDRVMVLNSQSYMIGQYSIDSIVMSTDVMQEVDRVTESSVST